MNTHDSISTDGDLAVAGNATVTGDLSVTGAVTGATVTPNALKIDTSAISGFAAATNTAGTAVYAESNDAGSACTAARTGGLISIKCGDGSGGAAAVDGGAGGAMSIAGGVGGDATGTGTAGAGGAASVTAGAGGANTNATGGDGGAGGAASLVAGAGGATADSAGNTGGAGGSVSITAGGGGAASAGTSNGGAGGSITLTPGTGGTSSGGAAGADGTITLAGPTVLRTLKVNTSAITSYTAATNTAGADVYAETQDAGGTATAARAGGAFSLKMGDGSAGATTVAGGAGGALTLAAGIGGATSGSGTAGAGGAASLSTGAGAANTGGASGAAGGAGGALTLSTGAGGATNSTAAHAGGAGGSIAITAAAGGNATAGSGNGGVGGSIVLTPGTGGTSSGGSAGTNGIVNVVGELAVTRAAASTSPPVLVLLGTDTTHGLATYKLTETVACSAVENAMATAVPKGAVIRSVSANCEGTLTAGSTTVTWSLGITGTVNKYGTAGWPTQADSLLKNTKSNRVLATVELTAAETIKVIGAATGGAAAGDTALSVGSVKVEVIYDQLIALADAA